MTDDELRDRYAQRIYDCTPEEFKSRGCDPTLAINAFLRGWKYARANDPEKERLKAEVERLRESLTTRTEERVIIEKQKAEISRRVDVSAQRDRFAKKIFQLNDLLRECQEQLQIFNKCRCDDAWTKRNRHEPNTWCGEADDLLEKLRAHLEGK